MFCTNCGAQHPDGTKFCTSCGSMLKAPEAPAAEPAAMPEPVFAAPAAAPEEEIIPPVSGTVCATCGESLPEGRKFCTNCGAAVAAAAPSAPVFTTPVEAPFSAVSPSPAEPPKASFTAPAAPSEPAFTAPAENTAPAADSNVCANCGAILPEGMKFCTSCGTAMAAPGAVPADAPAKEPEVNDFYMGETILLSQTTTCTNCGAVLAQGRKFCTNCGSTMIVPSPVSKSIPQPVLTEKEQKKKQKAEAKAAKAAKPKKKKTWKIVLIIVLVLLLAAGGVAGYLFYNWETTYKEAVELKEDEKYGEAIEKLQELDGYKDSEKLLDELTAYYDEANELITQQQYDEAAALLEKLSGYKDSDEILEDLNKNMEIYDEACALLEDNDFDGAKELFAELGDFSNSKEMAAHGVDYQKAIYIASNAAKEADPAMYEEAARIFASLGSYQDSLIYVNDCFYSAAEIQVEAGNYEEALAYCDLVDSKTAEKIRELYSSNCVDSIVWDTILESSELVPDGGVDADYREGLAVQISYLSDTLLDQEYENDDLQEEVIYLIDALEKELELISEDGSVSNWPEWYACAAEQYEILSYIAETLELGDAVVESCMNARNFYLAQSDIEAMLAEQLNGEVMNDGTEESTYYMVLNNDCGYGFTISYVVSWNKEGEDAPAFETEVIELTVEQGDTVQVPLYYPADQEVNHFYIVWETSNITLDGELLPGQD